MREAPVTIAEMLELPEDEVERLQDEVELELADEAVPEAL